MWGTQGVRAGVLRVKKEKKGTLRVALKLMYLEKYKGWARQRKLAGS